MKHKYNLTVPDIKRLINDLEEYKNDIISKTEKFCKDLSEKGIEVAKGLTSGFEEYVYFEKKVDMKEYGCEAIMIMADAKLYESEWLALDKNGEETTKTNSVSMTLMLEFGSGKNADAIAKHQAVVNNKVPVGRGTFPSENNKPFGNENHAWQNSWAWKDAQTGEWKHSSGSPPSMPMYIAYLEMEKQIKETARNIWKKKDF